MKATVIDPRYGEIVYDENAWTGKKTLTVNGSVAVAKSKTLFAASLPDGGTCTIEVKGSYIAGVVLKVDGESHVAIAPAKWYEWLGTIVIIVIGMMAGNVPAIAATIYAVGGAIGGAISGGMGMGALLIMKSQDTLLKKALVWAGMLVGTLVALSAIGILIVGMSA